MAENHEKEDPKTVENCEQKKDQKVELIADGEFKITVRKLEIPVRPRGVLAE